MGQQLSKEWAAMLGKSWQPQQWFEADHDDADTVVTAERTAMWVYRKWHDGWQVGFFTPDRQWIAESSYETREAAASRVHYLNGGNN